MHVGVNTDIGLTSERYNQHKIGSLSPDAWQCQQFVHGRWHLLVESGHQLAARLLHMSRFISIETDGIDEVFYFCHAQSSHCARACRSFE